MKQHVNGFPQSLKAFLTVHRKRFVCLAILVLLVTIFCSQLFTPGLPVGTDLLLLTVELAFVRIHSLWLSLWMPLGSFGYPIFFGTQFNFILIIFSLMGDPVLATKLYVYSVFVLAGFSMYFFARHYTKHDEASLLAAIVFVFNPIFILETYAGHHTIILGYALAPLVFLTYDKAMITGKLRDIIPSSITIAILFMAGHPQTAYIFGLFLLLFTVLELISPRFNERRLDALKKVGKVSVLTIGFWALLSAYEILPVMFNVLWSNALFALGYTIEDATVYSDLVYYPYLIALPFLVTLTYLVRKHRYAFFFSFSALVSAIISMGPNPPFGEVFTWAFVNIPLFNMFRVPYRFSLMTAFAFSFIVAFVLSKELSNSDAGHLASLPNKGKSLFLALIPSKKMVVTIAFVVIVVAGGLYVGLGAFGFPLGTYSFADSYTETYEWIGQQPGDYRILTVPYPAHYVNTSLMSGVNRGWIWDPPVYSQAVDGKVVITGYGGLVDTSDFLSFLSTQISDSRTDDLMKLLGALNTRYVTIHPYPMRDKPEISDSMRAFFSFQRGLETVYRSDNITVMENDYWTPRVFAAGKYGVVVGGRDVFTSLMDIDTFDLSQWVLVFANQVDNRAFDDLIKNADLLVFSSEGLRDLAMMRADAAVKIRAVDYAYPSADPWKHWIASKWWTDQGKLVMNGASLRTNGSNSLDIPFDLESSQEYTISTRVAYAHDVGSLAIFLDGSQLASFKPYSNGYSGFKWKEVGSIRLDAGRHTLRIENMAEGLLDIDEIELVPTAELKSQVQEIEKEISASPAPVIYLMEAESDFTYTDLFGWRIEKDYHASNGYALSYDYDQKSSRLSADIFIANSGEYTFAARVRNASGHIAINVDNSPNESIFTLQNSELGWEWVSLGPLNLTQGQHKIFIQSTKASEFDELILYSAKELRVSPDEIFSQESDTQISYEQINSHEYKVHVDATKPFFIVFSESYHPLWKAYVDGNEVSAIPAYSFINAFYVPEGGSHSILLEFTGQKYVTYGGLISLVSIICMVTYLIVGAKVDPFLKRKFNRTKNRH